MSGVRTEGGPSAEPDLHVGVLGPLSLVVDGVNVAPSAPKPRQLLALLMLNVNRTVQASECITELWGSDPPKTATSTLQTYVLYLRQILRAAPQDCGNALVTRNHGYQLRGLALHSDRLTFEFLTRTGRDAAAVGDYARSAVLLRDALALWRGPALTDVLCGPVSSTHLVELAEAHYGALELRVEADLRLGRHRELLDELADLTTSHPTHENIHAQYMVALYRSGERARALSVYDRLRSQLADSLGIEPVPRMRRLRDAVRAADPVLDVPTPDSPRT